MSQPLSHVFIHGVLELYKAKAPYVQSGQSVLGAVEYDPQKDVMKCHECGEVKKNVAHHIKVHGLTAREYKLKHGLRQLTALVSEDCRLRCVTGAHKSNNFSQLTAAQRQANAQKSAAVKRLTAARYTQAEQKNLRMHCAAQLLASIKRLADSLGRTPSSSEMTNAGIEGSLVAKTFGSIRKAQELAGLAPNKNGGGRLRYSDDQLLEYLRILGSRHNGKVSFSDLNREKQISATPYYQRFGSWAAAKKLAGVL